MERKEERGSYSSCTSLANKAVGRAARSAQTVGEQGRSRDSPVEEQGEGRGYSPIAYPLRGHDLMRPMQIKRGNPLEPRVFAQ